MYILLLFYLCHMIQDPLKLDLLKLDQQICFPVYATSRLITKLYQPLLSPLGLTYPQYLVLLVLWENDELPVKRISERLILESNTLTPLLKRMEKMDLLNRTRSIEDERVVIIKLTQKGQLLKKEAQHIPLDLLTQIQNESLNVQDLLNLKQNLTQVLEALQTLDLKK